MTVANGHVKRSSGELYDAVISSLVPDVHKVVEATVRQVLMTMAHFTNPSRDQFLGAEREWRCFASIGTIAGLIGCSDRQVQRTLQALELAGYIVADEPARGPGRPREGEAPGHGRGVTYCLRPDRWTPRPPKRCVETGATGDTHLLNKRRTLGAKRRTPVSPIYSETVDPGEAQTAETVDPGVTLTPETFNPRVRTTPGEQPPRAPAREWVFEMPPPQAIISRTETNDYRPLVRHPIACGAQQHWPPGVRCKDPTWHELEARVAVTA